MMRKIKSSKNERQNGFNFDFFGFYSKSSSVAANASSTTTTTPSSNNVDVLPEKGAAEQEHSASLAIFFVLCVLGRLKLRNIPVFLILIFLQRCNV